MIYAYPKLVSEITLRRISRKELAAGIGMSQRALYSKLMGATDFTLSEAEAIHRQFFPDMDKDILFRPAEKEDTTCTTI